MINDSSDDYDPIAASSLTRTNDASEEYDEAAATNLTRNKAEGQSPGEILYEARRGNDYTIEDLCAQTKLSRKTVHALENNDFAALSQPVFARGYYRQCAKVLDIDSDRLMAAYAAWGGEAAPRPASPGAVQVVPEDVTPQRRRAFGILLVLVLLIAAGAVYLLMPGAGLPGANRDGRESTVSLSDRADEAAATDGTSSTGADSNDDGAARSGAGADRADTNDVADTELSTDSVPAVPPEANNLNQSAPSGGRNVSDSLGLAPEEPPPEAEPAAPANANRLVLRFDNRSWVDVRDADGTRLLTGIYEGGETREFDAAPPYQIALGRAIAVDVTIGGNKVDLAAQTASNGTARLTVAAPANASDNAREN